MHIGILQTDHVLDQFQGEFGNYPSMFQDLLRSVREDLTFTVYDVQAAIPSEIVCDAYLITGSRHSVYDDFPWIQALVDYLKEVLASEKKILGICFGHQLMAHYFGGCVGPADAGWAVGVHTSAITREPTWMGAAPAQVNLVSSHKDQVPLELEVQLRAAVLDRAQVGVADLLLPRLSAGGDPQGHGDGLGLVEQVSDLAEHAGQLKQPARRHEHERPQHQEGGAHGLHQLVRRPQRAEPGGGNLDVQLLVDHHVGPKGAEQFDHGGDVMQMRRVSHTHRLLGQQRARENG